MNPVASRSAATPTARLIAAVSLGNGLEMYDFTIYSFFSVYIAATFFPAGDKLTSLLLAVGTFGVGFLFRPVGALVLGRYADRAGRRAALTTTIWLMAGGTVVIALCPGYATLGVAAPLVLVLGRLAQGFSAGGEVGAATSLLLEASSRRRGFTVSWQLASQGAATFVGAGSGLLLTTLLAPSQLAEWGWRVPFLIGLLIAPVGAYIRRSLPDDHCAREGEVPSLGTLFATERRLMLLAIPVVMGSTVTSYVMVYFMPSFLIRVAGLPASTSFAASVFSSVLILVVAPLAGWWSDRLPRRKPLVMATYGVSVLSIVPVFAIITSRTDPLTVMLAIGWIAGLITIGSTAALIVVLEAFAPAVRATGFGLVYAAGVTVFGGSAQFVVTWLVARTGSSISAGYYVMACELLGLTTFAFIPERRNTAAPTALTAAI